MCDQIVHLLASLAFGNRSLQLISGSRYAQYLAMSEKLYRAIKSQVRAVHDELEDWIFEAFREGGLPECESDEEQDLKEEVAQRRRGMRYFAAGRPRDRKQFASMLFPIFQGDPNEQLYQEAFHDILRVAGTSVKAKSRHKLSFGISVLFFTAGQGNLPQPEAHGTAWWPPAIFPRTWPLSFWRKCWRSMKASMLHALWTRRMRRCGVKNNLSKMRLACASWLWQAGRSGYSLAMAPCTLPHLQSRTSPWRWRNPFKRRACRSRIPAATWWLQRPREFPDEVLGPGAF
ncbi:unnamed protein product [Effrenium voratum]|nr:unnamed protein product [Effrenium voratum]